MSDVMDERMMTAELRRLERLLDIRKRELDDIEAKTDLMRPKNKRYNVDFTFAFVNLGDNGGVPIYVDTKSVAVDRGTRFFVKGLEQHYSLTSTGAVFNLGPTFMRRLFNYEWQIRDTGSDREWQNTWLPSDFLYSGDVRGLDLGDNNHAIVSGGSNIEVTVRVVRSSSSGTGTLFETIQQHLLQVSLVGVEVPEDFAAGDRTHGARR